MTVQQPDPTPDPGLPTNLNIRNEADQDWDNVEVKQPFVQNLDMGGFTLLNLAPDHLVPDPQEENKFLRSVVGTDPTQYVPSWTDIAAADLSDQANVVRADGTVAMTANLDTDGNTIVGLPAESQAADHAVSKAEVLAMAAEFQARIEALTEGLAHSAAVIDILTEPPASPIRDTYYIVADNPTGDWLAYEDHVAHWDGTKWNYIMPELNEARLVQSKASTYAWNGTSWVKVASSGSVNAGAASLFGVGDIRQSILTETQFKAQLGPAEHPKWVLADGRNVAGTEYASLTGNQNVPDLRGAYLRMAGLNNSNNAWNGGNLASYQEDSTARPKTAFRTDTTGNHSHTYQRAITAYDAGVNAYAANNNDGGQTPTSTTSSGNHSHSINQGGDAETRPKTYTVNYFLKVDA